MRIFFFFVLLYDLLVLLCVNWFYVLCTLQGVTVKFVGLGSDCVINSGWSLLLLGLTTGENTNLLDYNSYKQTSIASCFHHSFPLQQKLMETLGGK